MVAQNEPPWLGPDDALEMAELLGVESDAVAVLFEALEAREICRNLKLVEVAATIEYQRWSASAPFSTRSGRAETASSVSPVSGCGAEPCDPAAQFRMLLILRQSVIRGFDQCDRALVTQIAPLTQAAASSSLDVVSESILESLRRRRALSQARSPAMVIAPTADLDRIAIVLPTTPGADFPAVLLAAFIVTDPEAQLTGAAAELATIGRNWREQINLTLQRVEALEESGLAGFLAGASHGAREEVFVTSLRSFKTKRREVMRTLRAPTLSAATNVATVLERESDDPTVAIQWMREVYRQLCPDLVGTDLAEELLFRVASTPVGRLATPPAPPAPPAPAAPAAPTGAASGPGGEALLASRLAALKALRAEHLASVVVLERRMVEAAADAERSPGGTAGALGPDGRLAPLNERRQLLATQTCQRILGLLDGTPVVAELDEWLTTSRRERGGLWFVRP